MPGKDKDKPKGTGAGRRKVGAVVMQRRGARARIKKALTPEIADNAGTAAPAPLKRGISRLKRTTRALASHLSPGAAGSRPRRKPK